MRALINIVLTVPAICCAVIALILYSLIPWSDSTAIAAMFSILGFLVSLLIAVSAWRNF